MSNNVLNIKLAAKDSPTVYISINEAGSVSGTGSVSPVIKFVASGEAGPQGAQGPQGTIEGTDVISTTNIQNSAVTTIKLDDDSVTNDKLAPNSVYGNAIQDYSIVNSKLGPDAVTSDKIQDNAITSDHIAPNAINEELIESGIITNASIASKTISSAEIQNGTLVKENFQLGTIDGTVIVNNLTLTGILTTNGYKNLGQSPGVYEGPDDEDMHLKYHQGLDFVNTNGTVVASFDQTGNFSLSGTVDGIDIATDVAANTLKNTYPTADATKVGYLTVTQSLNLDSMKTKLDGIEDNATGDQTAAEIRALVDLAYDSEVFTDADHAKLDGIEAGATADQTAEEIQDIIGPFIATGGTKTGIAITYDDANNDMDFVVDHDAATNFVAEEHYRWDNDIQSTATINHANLSSDTANNGEVLSIVDGDAVWGHPEKVHLEVRNDEGATIPAGAPLYSKGEVGGSNRILVGICDADDSAKMPCIGIAETEMNTSSTQNGFAIISGVYNTNITGFTGLSVNDILYVQNDGSLDSSRPSGANAEIQNVGIVLKTNGTICQGLLVSTIGRTNDLPKLPSGYFWLGNAGNIAQQTDFSDSVNYTLQNQTTTLLRNIAGQGNDFTIESKGEMKFIIDMPDDETGQFFTFHNGGNFGGSTEIANLDESGNLQIDGDLTVSGNEIKDDDGTTCITFDSSGNTTIANTLNANVTGDLTGNASTATALTAGNKTLDGNFTLDTNHTLTTPFLNTYQIGVPSGTDNDLTVISNGNIKFTLDNNTNETSQSFTFRNHTGMGSYDDMLTLSESGDLTIYGSSLGDPKIKLQQNTNSATFGPPILEFFRNASSQDNSDLGLIQFRGRDSGGSETTYAEIHGICEESGSGTEGGKIEFKVASHDAELITGLKIEDGDAEDEVDVTLGNGSASSVYIPGVLTAMSPAYFGSAPQFSAGLDVGSSDTTLTRTAAGEVSIEGNKIVTENYVKHVLNCGWYGSSTSRVYLPFGYGGTFEATSSSGYLEYGAFIAPCNGTVDFVAIRSEEACGNSNVGIHIATNGTEMPGFNPGTYLSPTVNMSADDTSYKFNSFTNQGGSSPSFNAGDVIVVSFDPTNASNDTVATLVLNLDWTNAL